MRPPAYRNGDKNHAGVFLNNCFKCMHERQFKGVPTCLKHYAQVQMNKTCGDWHGGHPIGNAPEVGLHGGMYYHDTIPNRIETAALESGWNHNAR